MFVWIYCIYIYIYTSICYNLHWLTYEYHPGILVFKKMKNLSWASEVPLVTPGISHSFGTFPPQITKRLSRSYAAAFVRHECEAAERTLLQDRIWPMANRTSILGCLMLGELERLKMIQGGCNNHLGVEAVTTANGWLSDLCCSHEA